MKAEDDPFDLENLRLPPEQLFQPRTPHRIAKRREHFIKVPFEWLVRLEGASGKSYALALHLLYLHWRHRGKPFRLPNGMLRIDGISRPTKWRALGDLQCRGLISVGRRPNKSPLIAVNLFQI
jgi:hypothetical protein